MRNRRQPPQAPPPDPVAPTRVSGTTPARRPVRVLALLFAMAAYSSWAVYRYQFENLPVPLTADQAGKRGFSEAEAMKHVRALTQLGPHPVGSDALDIALKYVLEAAEKIKETAHWEVDVQVDLFHLESGANRLASGLFAGKTLVYSDLSHVVVRILPKYSSEAEENAILVSSHIDTVFSTGGAGDCSSCVAVMLELARGVSQWAHGFKNAVIFLFNTGEEEGLNGAHSFVTQHPWSSTIRAVVDLEAMGVGGKSGIFQAGPQPFAIENFASAAKYPSGHVIAQDLFSSGLIKSGTDFQVYKEIAGLSGLDFAFTDHNHVYHTKVVLPCQMMKNPAEISKLFLNDKLELLKSGSLQHLGENMLAFLLKVGSSSQLPVAAEGKSEDDNAIYFDILGTYMIVYKQRFANMLHNSVILQSLLIWATSLLMGGLPGSISFGLSCLSAVLMWLFSLSFSVAVAFVLPLSPSPVPYIAYPWLALGLFAAPALIGALTGQHLGYLILQNYLLNVYSKRKQLSPSLQADLVKLEAERWLFKAGFVQWLALLIVGSYYKLGSTYVTLFWLVPPAFSYGMLEATLTPARLPKPLKLATLMIGLAVPIVTTAGTLIRLVGTVIGIVVRFDRDPGGTPDWLGNIQVSLFIAAVVCLTHVYILSYVHLSGATRRIIVAATAVFGISLVLVLSGAIPPFTEDSARAVNVVHVVDATESYSGNEEPSSYISLFSTTPGKLIREVEHMKEGFICGKDKVIDLVTFSVKYGCVVRDDTEDGWTKSDIPVLQVDSDIKGLDRITKVSVDTKDSFRWCLAINTEEIKDFVIKGNSEELVPLGNKTSVQGWHLIQFSGGKDAPRKFELTLFWANRSSVNGAASEETNTEAQRPLLKLRTDVDRLTPKAECVMESLPPWCSLFGKSTSPYSLAFLNSLPINL